MILSETLVSGALLVLALYLGIGAFFSIAFVTRGVAAIDANSHGASWGFRALIFPGAVALWPLLARRWFAARAVGPRGGA